MSTHNGFIVGMCLLAASIALRADPLPPSSLYPNLFADVQTQRIFPDSKTFADAVPLGAPDEIERDYMRQRTSPGFSLAGFVRSRFQVPDAQTAGASTTSGLATPARTDATTPVSVHIAHLWSVLARPPVKEGEAKGSMLPLPAPYVVPGGRFRELYYWDSYFTMLGLMADGRGDLAQGLVSNFAFQIDQYGHVPNGSRSYYLSRSQPPFFHMMVGLLAVKTGATVPRADDLAKAYAGYLKELRREHAYWMDGADRLSPGQAWRHAVAMPDGAILNRYWDDRDTPRDESYREDVHTAAQSTRPPFQVYRDLRAGAESGWDYSSRWLANGHNLSTIQTTAILPVDLNSLLYGLEQAVSEGCRFVHDLSCMRQYRTLALRRRAAVDRYLWHEGQGCYVDYQWQQGRQQTQVTAATVVPLFMGLATPQQAQSVARVLRSTLLRPHGLVTTSNSSGQQWDAPNGWAPLQWMAVAGLRHYGQAQLAAEIAIRWMTTVDKVYRQTGKLMEKYNVEGQGAGGGGEYPGQDGFGWTNGVMQRLHQTYPGRAFSASASAP